MVCPTKNEKNAEILFDYAIGKLSPALRSEFENHIADCADCRVAVKAQQDVWEALDQWTPAEVSPDFDANLFARIAQENAAPQWTQWWRRITQPAALFSFWKPVVPLAAACAVLAVGLVVHTSKPTDTTPQIHNERVDIEQVEKTLEDLDLLTPSPQAPVSPM